MNINERRKYNLERVQKRRKEWFSEHGPCVDCRSVDSLEMDHVDPSTKVTHRIWTWAPKRFEEEAAKCVVRCRSCHRERTKKQLSVLNTKPFLHGVYSGYRRGCRCELCKAIYKVKRKAHFERTGN